MDSRTKLWKSYIKEKIGLLICYLIIVLTFFAVAGLYGYDGSVANMSYAVFLILFGGLCAGCIDYVRYRRKCRKLLDALSKEGEADYYLPAPGGLVEELYYELVCKTEDEKRRLISELDEKRVDMADYYTLWIHQIKTPIAALRLLQQHTEDELSSDSQRAENRRQSEEEVFKIEQYAEMALHYARLDSMSGDMMFKKYDINVIIKQAVKKYSVLFIGSGLSFVLEDFECEAVTDAKWLCFVMEQVISNALKYTKSGGIKIYGVDMHGEPCSGRVSSVVIEDTGIGIRESDLPRIFERGFTGYNGRMEKKSTGIGLYLCREIMDKLGHSIHAESEIGAGTRMTLGFVQENMK